MSHKCPINELKNMTYKVTYLPENKSKGGFRTLKDAWDYIAESFCDECYKEYIDHGTHGSCSDPWDIEQVEDE